MHATQKMSSAGGPFVEEVEVRGHIIDSLILPKILDAVAANGGKLHDQTHYHRQTEERPEPCGD